MRFADFFKPVRAFTACRDNDFVAVNGFAVLSVLTVRNYNALANAVLDDDIIAVFTEKNLYAAVNEVLFDFQIQLLRHFRAEMTDRAVNEFQVCHNGFFAYLADFIGVAYAFNACIRAKFQIYFVGIFDCFLRFQVADKLREIAADFA